MLMLFVLIGCSKLDEKTKEAIKEKSGISDTEQYVEAKNLVSEGKIDENGNIRESKEEITRTGDIHLTFSQNNNIVTKYYYDKDKKELITGSDAYINRGDSIYVDCRIEEDKKNWYSFDKFDIVAYEDDVKTMNDIIIKYDDGKYVLSVPKDGVANEYLVEPCGTHKKWDIELKVMCDNDADGVQSIDEGEWTIDDKTYKNSKTISVNPNEAYIVSFKYDENKYFLKSAVPECNYYNEEYGILIFPQINNENFVNNYKITLHKYLSVDLISETSRKIKINGLDEETLPANQKKSLNKMRYGSVVKVWTDSLWDSLENNKELLVRSVNQVNNGYEYVLFVPNIGNEFEFDPNKYKRKEHGSIKFSCFGKEINEKISLAQGTKIYFETETVDDGYELYSSYSYIEVGEKEETEEKLNSIVFTAKQMVTVNLEQPEYGGKINYYINGNQTYALKAQVENGTKIKMTFMPWEGWVLIPGVVDGYIYETTKEQNQSIKVDGHSVNTIFSETEEHKPELYVVLDESVGESLSYNVKASGLNQEKFNYESAFLRGELTIIDGIKIGTEKEIEYSFSNKALMTGKAFKVIVEKKRKDINETEEECIYITKANSNPTPIKIYGGDYPGYTLKWYKEIRIKVSIVDIYEVKKYSMDNACLKILDSKTQRVLREGDIIEPDTEVIIQLIPAEGYYIIEQVVSDEVYSEKMKYSKYVDNFDKISNDHWAKKYITIYLDRSDPFATYEYYLDGTNVTNQSKLIVKKGQTIKLKYTINGNDTHTLIDGDGVLMLEDDKVSTEEIKAKFEMDGKTLTRKDFNILLKGEA